MSSSLIRESVAAFRNSWGIRCKRDGPFTAIPGSYDRYFTEFSPTNSR
jgi:hypothetical protein